MAEVNEVVRRREIRRRKILENSEARWKKIITGGSDTPPSDTHSHTTDATHMPSAISESSEIEEETTTVQRTDDSSLSGHDLLQRESRDSSSPSPERRTVRASQDEALPSSESCSYRSSRDIREPNGLQKTRSRQTYAFPKKVSDAETRSYGRTKADARRSSSCTQLVIETLQLSSVGFNDIRHWLVMLVAICTRLWFSSNDGFLLMKSVFFPFLLLELAVHGYLNWSRKLVRRSSHSLLGAALLLCGIPSSYVTSFVHCQNLVREIFKDCAIFIFSFVLSHVIFEEWMCSDNNA